MTRWRPLLLLILIPLIALLAVACDDDDSNGDGGPTSTATSIVTLPPVTETATTATETAMPTVTATATATGSPGPGGLALIPSEVAGSANQWPLANHDYEQTRAVTDATIDSGNIDQLGVAWTYQVEGAGPYGAASSNTIVANNVVYFQDLGSNVFAFDLGTGQKLWEHRYDTAAVGPNGPAIGYGMVFAQVPPDKVVALDLTTGEERWSRALQHPVGAYQPVVYDGHVFVGTIAGAVELGGEVQVRGYAPGNSGHAFALDAETGDVAWDFMVVQDNFWGNPDVNAGGGIWYPPAIDLQTGTTYWGTGNPAPFPGTVEFPNGSSRPGDNPYSNSMLSIDHATGELNWGKVVNPEDLLDHDFQAPPILATTQIDGEDRNIVIGSGKLGRVIAFDRETGDTLWDVQVGEHENDDMAELPEGEGIRVLPGVYGGVETPMAYADGTLYAAVVNLPSQVEATAFGATDGTEAVQNLESRTEPGTGTGVLVALDVATGDEQWTADLDSEAFGGATVVNDLVIVPTFDGVIHAFSRDDGSEVWSWQAPGGIIAWPSVVGDTLILAAGNGNPPLLIALRIGATGEIPTATATPSTSPTPPATGTVEPTATDTATGTPGGSTTLEISTPEDNVFDTDRLEAPAGTEVTVNYLNDSPVIHNIHFFAGSDANTESLGATELVAGPGSTQSVTFTTPDEPGEYFFHCDVHPAEMTGTLVVQ